MIKRDQSPSCNADTESRRQFIAFSCRWSVPVPRAAPVSGRRRRRRLANKWQVLLVEYKSNDLNQAAMHAMSMSTDKGAALLGDSLSAELYRVRVRHAQRLCFCASSQKFAARIPRHGVPQGHNLHNRSKYSRSRLVDHAIFLQGAATNLRPRAARVT